MADAAERRKTANNGLNAHSSRSHLVVVYALCTKGGARRGQIALVDLAGSERLHRTEASGERLQEAVSINKSLSALEQVMLALQGKQQQGSSSVHVPYRNSKLTLLLSDALGARGSSAKTTLICQVNPSDSATSETIRTLGLLLITA